MKVRFISVCDNYDSFAPDAKNQELSMNIKNLVNDAYAKDISAKERAARRIAQKNGEYVGSHRNGRTSSTGGRLARLQAKTPDQTVAYATRANLRTRNFSS